MWCPIRIYLIDETVLLIANQMVKEIMRPTQRQIGGPDQRVEASDSDSDSDSDDEEWQMSFNSCA